MSKQATPPPPGEKAKPSAPPPPPAWRNWLWPVMIFAILALFFLLPTRSPSTSITYSQFLSDVSAHHVKTVQLASTSGGTSTGTLTDGKTFTVVIPPQAGQAFLTQLQSSGVEVSSAPSGNGFGTEVLVYLITFGLPILLFVWLFRRLSRGGAGGLQGIMGVGRSRAKVFDEERPTTKFDDVAGYEGAKSEISEVVDFLRKPDRYTRVGATVPRGVLMVGPPGTGKTLLARAVAGEAEVPFFSVTGSGFVELFVGVGAARVRDLFAEARKRAPAIIFIDEIDAIGQRRASGGGAYVSNDEREQTLNQLLAEMDGFEPTTGIVVLAATNRPEILDPALLRPGRFDREVTIPLPNVSERAAILAVHCRGKKLDGDVDLNAVARGTPGFSGADLANLVNEAAIAAVRGGRNVITAADFDAARDRIILGRREGSNVLLPEEKHAVAVHESGHALVAALSEHADPVAKVTILPAGQTLGVTEQLPLVERHMYGEDYLHDSLDGPARRPGRRAGGDRPGVHRGGQRPGRGDRPGHQDGQGVRPVRDARPDRVPRRRVGVPGRRRARHVQPPVRRGDPGGDRPRGLQAAARGRGTGDRAAQGASPPARFAGQPAARDGNRGRIRRVPAGRPARSLAPRPVGAGGHRGAPRRRGPHRAARR